MSRKESVITDRNFFFTGTKAYPGANTILASQHIRSVINVAVMCNPWAFLLVYNTQFSLVYNTDEIYITYFGLFYYKYNMLFGYVVTF